MIAILACILLAQAGAQQHNEWPQPDVIRWQLEHMRQSAEQERLDRQRASSAAAHQREACLALGESAAMHLRLYLNYSGAEAVNINAPRERKLWLEREKRFRACDRQ